jgi:hypothetical protein
LSGDERVPLSADQSFAVAFALNQVVRIAVSVGIQCEQIAQFFGRETEFTLTKHFSINTLQIDKRRAYRRLRWNQRNRALNR